MAAGMIVGIAPVGITDITQAIAPAAAVARIGDPDRFSMIGGGKGEGPSRRGHERQNLIVVKLGPHAGSMFLYPAARDLCSSRQRPEHQTLVLEQAEPPRI